ncbi:hypothetical protein [Nonomuraea sp. NPDC049709]|uniref:hypothetical protein n=1 Tax=Nonomuraea sp. NPDC049709 TaxID=3154736 RepID=UPI00343E5EBE
MDSEPRAVSAAEDWQRQTRIERRRTQRKMLWYAGVSAGSLFVIYGLAGRLEQHFSPVLFLALCVGATAVFSFLIHWMWFRDDAKAKEGQHRRPLGAHPRQPNWKTVMLLSALVGAIVAWPISKLLDVIFK